MLLERWDPFRELRRTHGELRRSQTWGPYWAFDPRDRAVALDVLDEADEVVVRASLPGVKPEAIAVSIEDGVLQIKGEAAAETEREEAAYLVRERRSGAFRRTLRLPEEVDVDKAASAYENGVLTVTLPKTEAKKAKVLKVEVPGK